MLKVNVTDVSVYQKGIGKKIIHSKVVILRSSMPRKLEMKFRKSKDFIWIKENRTYITFFTKLDVLNTTELIQEVKWEGKKLSANDLLLSELKSSDVISAKSTGIDPRVLRSRVRRLREKGFKIYGYRGRGYSLEKQELPTEQEQHILDLLLTREVWSKEDLSISLYGDAMSARNISCIITRLRKRGYRIINRQKRGYLLV